MENIKVPTLDNQAIIVIMQGALALMFAGVICYLYATTKPVPETLVQLELLILGFFFGGRVASAKTNGFNTGVHEAERAQARERATHK